MADIKCVLLDIEGTICPISFVKDTLFPYALEALPNILATKWDSEEFQPYREAFPENAQSSPADFNLHVEDLTRRDVKIAYLKNLQGYLWETGYKTGAYSTPLFPDVAPQLKDWAKDGVKLIIYSSGSVFAQKLLFGHVASQHVAVSLKRKREGQVELETVNDAGAPSPKRLDAKDQLNDANIPLTPPLPGGSVEHEGEPTKGGFEDGVDDEKHDGNPRAATEDLQYLISDWFDTTSAGLKHESQSYEKIARALKLSPAEILFFSDNIKEVDAAVAAGMGAIIVDRPGNAPLAEADVNRHRVVNSLEEVSVGRVETNAGKVSPQSNTRPARRSGRLKAKRNPIA